MNATPPAEREELRLCSARLSSGGPLVDVLVRDGRVAEITPADPSRRPRDPDVDLHGRWLRPGLWDHHVHFDQWAQARRRIDLAGSTSAAAVARLVAEHLAARRTASTASTGLGAELIVGYGFRDALWPDLPERALLDSVSGGQPSVMVSGDLHCAWLNSAALRRFGHPVAGTGLLREAPAMRVLGQLSQLSAETSDALAREAGLAAAARGVVGIVDLEKP
ncbi:MAG: amidohydrolase, partial [Frankiales bacterium]|nr:amidohydrolase [Frankiales bacterium]